MRNYVGKCVNGPYKGEMYKYFQKHMDIFVPSVTGFSPSAEVVPVSIGYYEFFPDAEEREGCNTGFWYWTGVHNAEAKRHLSA